MASPLPVSDLEFIHQSTRKLWQEVRGQRIFMTGGTGFFGCWLSESFAYINRIEQLGASLTILSRDPEAFARKCPHIAHDPAISLLAGDARDFAYPDGEFPFVIHAATDAGTKPALISSPGTLDTILRGTEHTLDFAASHGTKKFLLTSSGAVYGPQPPSISHLSEDYKGAPDPTLCESVYAEGKRVAELLCAVYGAQYGIECKIARCFAFVGPHLPLDALFAMGNFLRDAMLDQKIQVKGDGRAKRSYMYASDLAVWLWTILFRAHAMTPINVGSEQVVSIQELARTIAQIIQGEDSILIAQAENNSTPLQQYVPSVRKAEADLSLTCTVSLQDAIRKTADWHSSGKKPV
jgi:dTDP-glucose 4,6-dehydratase